MTFDDIDKLVAKATIPLPWLDGLPGEHHLYHRFLYHLAAHRKPNIALEIGIWHGLGCAHMASALKDEASIVIGIDINRIAFSSESFIFVHGDSTTDVVVAQVEKFIRSFGPIGIVYQDSSHHYLPSKREWEIYSKLLDKDAIWICDDIRDEFYDPKVSTPGKGMVQYWNELPVPQEQKRLYKDTLREGSTQGIMLL